MADSPEGQSVPESLINNTAKAPSRQQRFKEFVKRTWGNTTNKFKRSPVAKTGEERNQNPRAEKTNKGKGTAAAFATALNALNVLDDPAAVVAQMAPPPENASHQQSELPERSQDNLRMTWVQSKKDQEILDRNPDKVPPDPEDINFNPSNYQRINSSTASLKKENPSMSSKNPMGRRNSNNATPRSGRKY